MMVTPMRTVHEIRLANNDGLLHGMCSCGWTSREVAVLSAAAVAAVTHTRMYGGVASIETTKTTSRT
jgi:hypothetical protein